MSTARIESLMSRDWSKKIGRCYSLALSDDLVDWFDQQIWRESFGGDFRFPLEPERLLQPDAEWVWPGFMLPDTLPFVGNDRGDWLCLRIDETGAASEVIQWYHGGGDWTPYGSTIGQALAIDATRPGDLTRHAHPPDLFLNESGKPSPQAQAWLQAHNHLESESRQIVACRQTALAALKSPLKTMCDPATAEKVGIPWEPDFVRSLFDSQDLDPRLASWLTNKVDSSLEELVRQDWETAEDAAKQVVHVRGDLAWAFDVAGWAAERRGDLQLAVDRYWQGSTATAFTDEAIKLRSHWYSESRGKFCCARLHELCDELTSEQRDSDYLQLFCLGDAESLRSRVRDYWIAQAKLAHENDDPGQAYQCFYRAGWDLGLQFLSSYEEIYAGLIESAEAAGWDALAKLAGIYADRLST